MMNESIEFEYIPKLYEPLLIAGFDGWGNALDISRGMVDYLSRKLEAKPFGTINPDYYYRYDEKRPAVSIEEGILKKIDPPGGVFFVVDRDLAGRDLILLNASEPQLKWYHFADSVLTLCRRTGVKTIISLGSMYDNVLHTDNVISALASSKELLATIMEKNVISVSYKGPGGIHSTISSEAIKEGFKCLSLWCHCPYYLQGTTHFGLLSHLGTLLADWGGFNLDTEELTVAWKELGKQIQSIIDKNPELQGMIQDLRKTKVRGVWDEGKKHNKIIQLHDFLKPK